MQIFYSRIFDDVEESIKFAKELESTGITAIAVHGRTRKQQSTEPINTGKLKKRPKLCYFIEI